MFGKISWWVPAARHHGYGFIEIIHEDHSIERFFALGSRLLTDVQPVAGMDCEFEPAEAPRQPHQYQLAAKIRILKPAAQPDVSEGVRALAAPEVQK